METSIQIRTKSCLVALGQLVRVRRVEKGITVEAYATSLGVGPDIVRAVEAGEPGVSAGHFVAVVGPTGKIDVLLALLSDIDEVPDKNDPKD